MDPGPDGKVYLVKALRAVHVASAAKVAMHQVVIPAHRGEAPMFEGFVRELIQAMDVPWSSASRWMLASSPSRTS